MNLISTFVSEHLINALGWTIIHSLWQGAVVALGFALVMFFMRRFSARARYTAGVMALMLMLAMSIVTFVSLYHGGAPGTLPVTGGDGSELALTGAVEMENGVSLMAFFKNYFNRHLPLVVTVWLLGVLVLMLRLAGGFLYNQRIKVHRTRPLPASWQNRLQAFCRQAGIQKPIRLVESALIKIPTTIGFLKPVILFPMGLVTGMPRDQVEALLAHELAHILRKDYLVNILQNFLDILYFYHPGVRWVSTHVRSERENCCDDIAVSLSGDSVNVARALTNIQGFDLGTTEPALAAAGSRSGSYSLLGRVKRLLRPPTKGSGFSEGLIGASILLVGLLTLVVSANAATALNRDMQKEKSSTQEKAESVESAESVETEESAETGEKARLKELQKKEKEKLLQIEDMLIAEEMEVKRLNEELQKMGQKLKQKQKKMQEAGIKKLEEAEIKKWPEIKKWEDLKKKLAKREHRLQQYQLKKQEALMGQQEMIMRAKEKEMRKLEGEMRKKEAEMRTKETEEMREQEKEFRKQEAKMREMEREMSKQEAEMREQEKEMRKQEAEMRKQEKELVKADQLMKTLVNELLRDKLIDDGKEFEFGFKEGKLYINGKKQSKKVFKKYKELYEKGSGKELDDKTTFRIVNKR